MNSLPPNPARNGDDELHPDPRLRSALQHAPDGASRPPLALRSAVLKAARASLPPRPSWWQRLLAIDPGQAGVPRLWAAAAGVGAFGLALNLAWHLSTAPTSTEFDEVAVVSEAKRSAQPAPTASVSEETAAVSPAPAPTQPTPRYAPLPQPPAATAQAPVRRDAAPKMPAPVPATPPAPAAPPVPIVTAAPAREAEPKALAKPEPANTERLADATPGTAPAESRTRGAVAPQAAAPTGIAAVPAPGSTSTDGPRPEAEPLAATTAKPAAPSARDSLARGKPADKAPALDAWPAPLARFSSALDSTTDWPPGWQVQGRGQSVTPSRAWWQAMLAGTSGRWEVWPHALPPSIEVAPSWRLHGPDGTAVSVTVGDGQAWLQAGGAIWRAPWTVMPAR